MSSSLRAFFAEGIGKLSGCRPRFASSSRALKSSGMDNERGATMVEAVIVIPIFLVLLIVSADLLRLSFNIVSMRFATSRVMRTVSLGTLTAGEIRTAMITTASDYKINLANENISMCRLADYPCAAGQIADVNAGDLFVLEVRIPMQGLIFGAIGIENRVFNQRASAIGKMEPEDQ